MSEIINSYYYNNPEDKTKIEYIVSHKLTKYEEYKTEKLDIKLLEFEKIVRGNNKFIVSPINPEVKIDFREKLGYISWINPDKDRIDVYYYGKKEEEAFINAVIDYEISVNRNREYYNRKKGYDYGELYIAKESLQDFKKYYNNNIPQVILDYFEEYIKNKTENNVKRLTK